jgi:VanZ family protein
MQTVLTIVFILFCAAELYNVFKLKKMNQKLMMQAALISFSVFVLLMIVYWLVKLKIPEILLIFAMIAIWCNSYFGYSRYLFETSRIFDRFMHAYGTFSYTLLVFAILRNFVQTGGSKLFVILFVFTLGNTIGALFEIFEFYSDMKKGTHAQQGLKDTNMDMIFNVIGSVAAALYTLLFLI